MALPVYCSPRKAALLMGIEQGGCGSRRGATRSIDPLCRTPLPIVVARWSSPIGIVLGCVWGNVAIVQRLRPLRFATAPAGRGIAPPIVPQRQPVPKQLDRISDIPAMNHSFDPSHPSPKCILPFPNFLSKMKRSPFTHPGKPHSPCQATNSGAGHCWRRWNWSVSNLLERLVTCQA